MRKINKRQFTLIELIIVIVVIGILAAMALPKFLGVQRNAKVAAMEQDLDVIEKAVMQYVTATDDGSYPFLDLTNDNQINKNDLYFKTNNVKQTLLDSLFYSNGDNGSEIYKLDMDKLKPYISKLKYPDTEYLYSEKSDTAIDPIGKEDGDGNIHHIIGNGATKDDFEDVIDYYLDWEYIETDTGLTLTLYKGEKKDTLIVPNKLKLEDGTTRRVKNVKPTSYNIFSSSNDIITTIIISDGIERIENRAFCSSKNLSTIKLPKTLRVLSDYVFMDCYALSNIELPEGLIEIGTGNFAYCTSLKEIIIPNSVTKFTGDVFSQSSLETITIGSGITSIPENCFYGSRNLKIINMGTGLTVIPDRLFSGLSNLEKVNFAPNTEVIGDSFSGCWALKELTIPDSVKSVKGVRPFSGTSLEVINVGSGLTEIPDYFFSGIGTLKKINFSENSKINKFGLSVFSGCYNLESISIPEGVTIMGGEQFSGCSKLKTITLPNSLKTIEGSNVFSGCGVETINLGSGLTEIKDSLFSGCGYLKTLNFSKDNKITKINANAFKYTYQLFDLTLPSNISEINKDAFSNAFIKNYNVVEGSYADTWCHTKGLVHTHIQ